MLPVRRVQVVQIPVNVQPHFCRRCRVLPPTLLLLLLLLLWGRRLLLLLLLLGCETTAVPSPIRRVLLLLLLLLQLLTGAGVVLCFEQLSSAAWTGHRVSACC